MLAQKGLKMEDVASKHLLFEKLHPWRFDVEYANRGRGFHICGHRRPPIYRSRDPAKIWTRKSPQKALT